MKLFEFFKAINNLSDLSASFLLQALPVSALVIYCFMLRQKKLSSYTDRNSSTKNKEQQNITPVAESTSIPERCTMFAECAATQSLRRFFDSQSANFMPSGFAPSVSLRKFVDDKINSLFVLQANDVSFELSDEQAYDYFLILYYLISRKRDKYTSDINRLKAIPAIFEFWMMNVVCKDNTSHGELPVSNRTSPESLG